MLFSILGILAQTPGIKFVCSGSAEPYGCDPAYSITWSILDLSGNNVSSVGSMSGNYTTLDYELIGSGNDYVHISINTSGKYIVHASRYNIFGFRESSFDQDVSIDVDQPQVSISNLSSSCVRTVSVTNVQEGVSYTWNNGTTPGSTTTTRPFSGSTGTVFVSATQICGSQTSTITNYKTFTLPVSNNSSMSVTGTSSGNCSGGSSNKVFSVTATACAPFTSWAWSISNGSEIGGNYCCDAGTNSSNRTFSTSASGNIYVTITGTNPNGIQLSGYYTVSCFQGGTYGLQVSNDRKNVKGKSLYNTIISSENPDIVLNNPNSNVTVLSSTFIYPNPSNEEFTISGLEGIDEVRFTNVQGQVLQTRKITDGASQQNLKVAQYPNGLYFVQLKNTTGDTRIEKVQVNH